MDRTFPSLKKKKKKRTGLIAILRKKKRRKIPYLIAARIEKCQIEIGLFKPKKKFEIGPKGIELVIPLSYLFIFINNNNNQEEEEEEEEEEEGGGDDDDDDAR